MKGSEKAFRACVAKGLKPYGHVVQVENSVALGHPDTSYCIDGCEGHLELKYVRNWPKRASTPVKIDHYTESQRLWMAKRGMAGGTALLFIQVEKDYFLFYPDDAIEEVGIDMTKDGFYKQAYTVFKGKIDFDRLQSVLTLWTEEFAEEYIDSVKRVSLQTFQIKWSEDDK